MNNCVSGESGEYVTFWVDNLLCGMDILNIQEIKKLAKLTPVPNSASYIKGIMNMRGQIVTAVDIRQLMGLRPFDKTEDIVAVIIPRPGGLLGLLVDEVEDVVAADKNDLVAIPANLSPESRKYLSGVLRLEGALVSLLNRDKILEDT